MPSKVYSCYVLGIDPVLVEVEVDISRGLPAFNIVGLPDASVREARDRVRSAIRNSNFEFPAARVTVNLAPAFLKKEGPAFDLPMAIGILAEKGAIPSERLADFLVLGELSLDGKLRPVRGVLSAAIGAKIFGKSSLVIPKQNVPEAFLVDGLKIYGAESLLDAIRAISGEKPPEEPSDARSFALKEPELDFADVAGHEEAKRAIEIAAAGMHNLLFFGPPGTGKTMLARRIPTVMPEMTLEEIIETTRIYSVAGLLESSAVTTRPFRAPHHSLSDVALIGGGNPPRPGEVSLAHNGVLFLDELPEFKRSALEALRQPLEDGVVTVSRASVSVVFPARFMFVGAMNPCPCGFLGHPERECTCSPQQIKRYLSKISGPILDRIDMVVEIPAVSFEKLKKASSISSEKMRERVVEARKRQEKRFSGTKIRFNGLMGPGEIKKHCRLSPECEEILKSASKVLHLSTRGVHRILKVARTIADLEGSDRIEKQHLMEAIQYRRASFLEML